MEQAIISALANAGGVAILAAIIFMMYRKDRESSEKRIIDICSTHENRLREDRQQLVNMVERDYESREANTKATTELVTVLERMNGRH